MITRYFIRVDGVRTEISEEKYLELMESKSKKNENSHFEFKKDDSFCSRHNYQDNYDARLGVMIG